MGRGMTVPSTPGIAAGAAVLTFAPTGGRWVAQAIGGSCAGLTLNEMRLTPYSLPKCTIDRMGFRVGAAVVGGFIRPVAYFDNNGQFLPGKLAADGGQVDISATGLKSAIVNIAHPGGLLWVGIIPQVNTGGTLDGTAPSSVAGSLVQYEFAAQPDNSAQFANYFVGGIAGVPPDNPAVTLDSTKVGPRLALRIV